MEKPKIKILNDVEIAEVANKTIKFKLNRYLSQD